MTLHSRRPHHNPDCPKGASCRLYPSDFLRSSNRKYLPGKLGIYRKRSKGQILSTTIPFQLVSLIVGFVGMNAGSDRAENRRRRGPGRLEKRGSACEEGDFGIICQKKLRSWKLMLSRKMDCLSQKRVVHFAALLFIRFQFL